MEKIKLRKFQKLTSDYICKKINKGSSRVYSISDQVGLGKTWVVADVMARLVSERCGDDKDVFIFYVSPSQELIRQNLPKISRYIKNECLESEKNGGDYWVSHYHSRVSQLLRDMDANLKNKKKKHIHIVGLSSEVSFKWGGTGTQWERALIAAALYHYEGGRKSFLGGRKRNIFKTLYLLDLNNEYRYNIWKNEVTLYRQNKVLMSKFKSALKNIDWNEFEKEFESKTRNKNKNENSIIVSLLRKYISLAVVETIDMNAFILDEWHRYREICCDEKKDNILANCLESIRESEHGVSLLVSATPFVVKFDDEKGKDDLKKLCTIVFGAIKGATFFGKIIELQREMVEKIYKASLLAVKKGMDAIPHEDLRSIEVKRASLEKMLRSVTVRNQRPYFNQSSNESQIVLDDYYEKAWSNSRLLKKIADKDSRSPVVNLWNDSLVFPVKKDYKISSKWIGKEKYLGIDRDKHWKVDWLQDLVSQQYDKYIVGGELLPPLWITKNNSSSSLKKLIFSNWQVTPDEVSEKVILGDSFTKKGNTRDDYDNNLLGSFPFKHKGKNRDLKYGWEIFFPFVYMETTSLNTDEVDVLLQDIYADDGIELGLDEMVFVLDYHICNTFIKNKSDRDFYLNRIKYRAGKMHSNNSRIDNTLKKVFEGDLKVKFSNYVNKNLKKIAIISSPGRVFSECLGDMFCEKSRRSQFLNLNEQYQRRLEESILRAAEGVLRLFSSTEAQYLRKKYIGKKSYMQLKKKSNYKEFVLEYCKMNELKEMLDEYFQVLSQEHPDHVEDLFITFRNAVTLKKGKGNSRYIRAFADCSDKDMKSMNVDGGDDLGKVSANTVREAFNSPFPPYLLVSTSIGQEGIDFHHYCSDIIHWAPPRCPSILEQREGRLDRFNSLSIRRLKEEYKSKEVFSDDLEYAPDFLFYDEEGVERLNKVNRTVLYLPYSTQAKTWKRCLDRAYLTGLLMGAQDPQLIEEQFNSIKLLCGEDEKKWNELLEFISSFHINLSIK